MYATAHGFEHARAHARAHTAAGFRAEPLDAAAARRLEPALSPRIAGAIIYPDEAECDPRRFVAAVGAAAEALGVRLFSGIQARAIHAGDSGVTVDTSAGALFAERVVVAAGVWSRKLLRPLMRLPVRPGKGYCLDVPLADGGAPLRRPVYLHESRVAITPLEHGARFAGTLELGALETSIDPCRVAGIRRAASAALPDWQLGRADLTASGLRPCTPDGLPAVGYVERRKRVLVATGHAMLGITLAPVTASLLMRLLDGEGIDDRSLRALNPERFAVRGVAPFSPAARRPPRRARRDRA